MIKTIIKNEVKPNLKIEIKQATKFVNVSISFYLNHDNKVIAVEGACLAHPIAI